MPLRVAAPVTPSDTAPNRWDALYVGKEGDLVVRPEGSVEDVTYLKVAAGAWIELRVVLVKATGTTATDIVGHR